MSYNLSDPNTDLIELSTTVDQISKLIVDMMQNYRPVLDGEHYISDAELSSILKISRRSLQQWRNDGLIPYILIRGKVLYRESDVQSLIDSSYYNSFAE